MTGRSERAGVAHARATSSLDQLQRRLDVLGEIAGLAPGRLPSDVVSRVAETAERARGRLGHGTSHTVVALAGATGSGKSSTFNALVGRPLAATGVRRPTTSVSQAAVFVRGDALGADAAGLLDWLGVRHHDVLVDDALTGLVLLDLPDHDSTEASHREEVDRLVRIVDVFVWVVDPQKYADAVLHHDYLRRFAGHAEVTIVVLNQIDRLAPEDRRAALDDLARLLAADGLAVARPGVVAKVTGRDDGVRLIGASAATGEGIDALRREIAARVSARRALVDRIDADVDWIADDLAAALGEPPRREVPRSAERQLADALAAAAGVDAVSDAVAAAHRQRGRRAAGWPPAAWLTRLRPDPLRRLGLDRVRPPDRDLAVPTAPARTSLPPPSPVATAAVSSALRQLAEDSAVGLPPWWRTRLHEVASARRGDLDDALDRAVGTAVLPSDPPRWWRVLAVVQRLLALALLVGLVWLAVMFAVTWFGLPDLPSVEVGSLPLPTVLALGGAALGLLLGALARRASSVGARRRAAVARRRITAAAAGVARELVVDRVDAELARLAQLHDLTARLRA